MMILIIVELFVMRRRIVFFYIKPSSRCLKMWSGYFIFRFIKRQ